MEGLAAILGSGVGAGLLSAALFGAATPLSKALLSSLPAAQLAGLLYLGAALGVLPAAVSNRSPQGGLAGQSLLRLAGAIVFGGVLAPLLFLSGLRLAAAASVSLWLNLEVVATALLGRLFFRDHLGRLGWAGVAGAVVAGTLLGAGEGAGRLAAGLLVGLACLCWALDNNLTALIDGISPARTTLWKGAKAGCVNLAIGLYTQPLAVPLAAVGCALVLGAFSYGASIALYINAAQRLGAARAQLLFATAPLFGVALSAVLLGETVTSSQAMAAGVWAASLAIVLAGQHAHAHQHAAVAHTHLHRHDDGHHAHDHGGEAVPGFHSHWHEHGAVLHAHPHWPDLHHRHGHP